MGKRKYARVVWFTVSDKDWSKKYLKEGCGICGKTFKDKDEACENEEFTPARIEHQACFAKNYKVKMDDNGTITEVTEKHPK